MLVPKYNVKCKLTGTDGNAFAIMGKVRQALKDAKASPEDVQAFLTEAMAADYDHLLRTCMEYVEVV